MILALKYNINVRNIFLLFIFLMFRVKIFKRAKYMHLLTQLFSSQNRDVVLKQVMKQENHKNISNYQKWFRWTTYGCQNLFGSSATISSSVFSFNKMGKLMYMRKAGVLNNSLAKYLSIIENWDRSKEMENIIDTICDADFEITSFSRK